MQKIICYVKEDWERPTLLWWGCTCETFRVFVFNCNVMRLVNIIYNIWFSFRNYREIRKGMCVLIGYLICVVNLEDEDWIVIIHPLDIVLFNLIISF